MILERKRIWTGLAQSALAVVLALLMAAVVILVAGRDPFAAFRVLLSGPLRDVNSLADVLGRSCPLMLCGLAVALAFRAQAWNIGVEGQYLLGAIAATAIGVSFVHLPGWLLIALMLAGASVAGALLAVPAVVLENRRQVPLVLSTILLNFVAVSFVSYLTQGPLQGADARAAQSDPIARQGYLPAIMTATDLHWGLLAAVAAILFFWVFIKWSAAGFELRVAGLNPVAAQWAGINVPAVKFRVMCLSGALGGLAGGIQIAGVSRLLNIQASEGFGYVGIAVALLGRLHPLGVAAAAIFIAGIDIAAFHVERHSSLGIPADLAQVIKGMIVLNVLVFSGKRFRHWLKTGGAARARALLESSGTPAESSGTPREPIA